MSVTVEQAHAIMQAVTVDVWNQRFKIERIKLLETYCSPQMKAYAPDGSETTGFEDVWPTTWALRSSADAVNSVTATTTSCTLMAEQTGCSRARGNFG